jgi:hypothetical protein
MEVLSPLDAAFLRLEDRTSSLHIASLAVFDGPPPSYDELFVASRRSCRWSRATASGCARCRCGWAGRCGSTTRTSA